MLTFNSSNNLDYMMLRLKQSSKRRRLSQYRQHKLMQLY